MPILKTLLGEAAHEASNTRRLLERVPAEHLTWRPHERSMTLGRLAGHIAEIPGWAGAILKDELDLAAGVLAKPFEPSSVGSLLVEFGCQVGEFHRALEDVTDEHLAGLWTLRRGDQVIATMSREAAIRSYVFRHVVHHRGQLSVYLRLVGVALPQIYGPTADQRDFTVEETEARREVGLVLEEELVAAA